jgi:septum formation protein
MLQDKLKQYKLILASGSPRRQQFFKDLELDFEIRLKEVEEIFPPHQKRRDNKLSSRIESWCFEGGLQENEILVTSDTIVWHNNKL